MHSNVPSDHRVGGRSEDSTVWYVIVAATGDCDITEWGETGVSSEKYVVVGFNKVR